ncbi:thioredoxin [Sediminitomix flava]|uniref:Thioredoxin n=1 Tax=Sediminitomix flava TaxID=379075 RepID=A0A315ZWF7_SEDFL|nr:thioredoxin [Sediminitomix flava]PWJ41023.1 thioredoxin [Sediminitomix flava]
MSKFQKLISDPNTPVLVDFYADWCQPCHALAPVLKEVAGNMGDAIKIIKVNVDKNQAVSQKYQVRSIPTMILFKGGVMQWRGTGVKSATELEGILKQHI